MDDTFQGVNSALLGGNILSTYSIAPFMHKFCLNPNAYVLVHIHKMQPELDPSSCWSQEIDNSDSVYILF